MAHEVKKAYVYRDSDGDFRVFPPVVVLGPGKQGADPDRFQLVNTTDEDLCLACRQGRIQCGRPDQRIR